MSTITKYGLLYTSRVGTPFDAADLENYMTFDAIEDAELKLGTDYYPGPIVTITIETPEPPLPTTVGSVIRVGKYETETDILLALNGDMEWVFLEGWYQGAFIDVEGMKNVTVLFDAGTVKEG